MKKQNESHRIEMQPDGRFKITRMILKQGIWHDTYPVRRDCSADLLLCDVKILWEYDD